jgi:hypothetical protein
MAELAIPLVALGSLFVIAQEDKKKKATEKYTNLNKKNIATEYPNPEPVNENNSLNYYPNSNQSTDRYFNETGFDNTVNKETISELEKVVNISSLTGNPVSRNDFKHNNMVPFFGGRIRGAGGNYDQAELRLDNMQGTGHSILFIKTKSFNELCKCKTVGDTKCRSRIKSRIYNKWISRF